MPSPFDPETHYRIEQSGSPPWVDDYGRTEPKYLVCEGCGASAQLDADPDTPGVDDLAHDPTCPNRFAKSRWFVEQV